VHREITQAKSKKNESGETTMPNRSNTARRRATVQSNSVLHLWRSENAGTEPARDEDGVTGSSTMRTHTIYTRVQSPLYVHHSAVRQTRVSISRDIFAACSKANHSGEMGACQLRASAPGYIHIIRSCICLHDSKRRAHGHRPITRSHRGGCWISTVEEF
jgi:hypothetical protein